MKNFSARSVALTALLIPFLLSGCSLTPKPITLQEQQDLLKADREKARNDVEPVGLVLTMNEAVARGLKYNLDHRSKMLEQAIALGARDLSKWDMMPKVLATAGYNYRNNYFITEAVGAYSGQPSLSEPFISSAKDYGMAGLTLSWSLLDFGVSYFNARQNSDRIVVAAERRRRTMHVLVQDIQASYLRAAAAQKLSDEIQATIRAANRALNNSQKTEKDGLKEPEDILKYQKSLLDNLKILETISQELATAQVELFQLINLPPTMSVMFEDPDRLPVPSVYAKTPAEEFELRAMVANADLKESIYNARIAVEETRKSMLKLFPGLTFNIGPQTTNNSFYINKNWVEGAANISFNLWNLLMAPSAIKLAEQNQELANQKRMMMQMAVVSQVHLSKIQLDNSFTLYKRSAQIETVDGRMARLVRGKFATGDASDAERVAADAASIVSKLRKYQALSQVFSASGKMQATTGLEPHFDSMDDLSLKDMTALVANHFQTWNAGELPPLPVQTATTNNTATQNNSASVRNQTVATTN